jgi:hypothetical protein
VNHAEEHRPKEQRYVLHVPVHKLRAGGNRLGDGMGRNHERYPAGPPRGGQLANSAPNVCCKDGSRRLGVSVRLPLVKV